MYVTGSNFEHVATYKTYVAKWDTYREQEIEKMEIKTGGRKEAVNANEETTGKAKGWGGKEFDEHV